MRPLAAVERFFERLLERPSARLFHAPLEPVAILRRVERAMEEGRVSGDDGTVVPDRFAVRIHPDDLTGVAAADPTLAADLADGALRFARLHGYRLRRRPRVDLVPDPRVASGDPSVDGRFDRSGESRSAWSASPIGGDAPAALAGGPAETPAGASPVDPASLEATRRYRPPIVAGPIARLRVLEPTGADRSLVVDGGGLSIGRSPDNDLVIGDGRASRHHARLLSRLGTLILVDLGSRNGTVVNGTIVSEVALGIGDEIRIGDTRLLVEGLPTG